MYFGPCIYDNNDKDHNNLHNNLYLYSNSEKSNCFKKNIVQIDENTKKIKKQ